MPQHWIHHCLRIAVDLFNQKYRVFFNQLNSFTFTLQSLTKFSTDLPFSCVECGDITRNAKYGHHPQPNNTELDPPYFVCNWQHIWCYWLKLPALLVMSSYFTQSKVCWKYPYIIFFISVTVMNKNRVSDWKEVHKRCIFVRISKWTWTLL